MKILIAIILGLSILAGVGSSFAQVQTPGFTDAVNLSQVSADSELPHVIVSSDGVFAMWTQSSLGR
ncbi:hypothetical protein, partial [Nitrosococcus oceani]